MLKAGFIGMGRMGITHYSILNTHPKVKIAAIADTSKTMRDILSRYLGVNTYADYRQMIQAAPLDFVIISTPTNSHYEVIKFAIDHKLHIFTEKPLSMTPTESREILELISGKDIVHQVGYVNRFNEVFMEVKKLLESGIIGELKSFTSEMYGATVLKETNSTWRGKHQSGGGCMYEFASHCLDLVVYLLGLPEGVAGSVLTNIYSPHVEDMVISTLKYNNGVSGTVRVNWSDASVRKPANIISFFGTKGKIIADKHAYKIFLKEDSRTDGFHKGWNTRYITDFARSVRVYVRGNEFTRQLDSFIDCIIDGNRENIADFGQAHMTDLLMDRIRADASSEVLPIRSEPDPGVLLNHDAHNISYWKKIIKRLGFNNA